MQGRMRWFVATIVLVACVALLAGQSQHGPFELVSTILFGSNRHDPACNPFLAAEIFSMSPNDQTNVRRLTNNEGCTHADAMAAISPDGKKIVFDSNRLTTNILVLPNGQPVLNISDLFVMDSDGAEPTFWTRGSSATWSPDGQHVAFHASASYHASGGLITLRPIRNDPGAPMPDSDIFIANPGAAVPKNITNSPDAIEEDADWSSQGRKIVFTRDPIPTVVSPGFNYPHKEIFTINADGTELTQLTFNDYEERAPAWSSDNSRIAFMCRLGGLDFEICVMDATNGANVVQLTNNAVFDGTPTWSPDGQKILFQRPSGLCPQLFVVDADTTCNANGCTCSAKLLGGSCEKQLTFGVCDQTQALNFGGPHWGLLRVQIPKK